MNGPDLQALQCGDAAEWDEAFRWLWPACGEALVKDLVARPALDPGTLGLKGTFGWLSCVNLVAHVVCFQGNVLRRVGLVASSCGNMRPKWRPVKARGVVRDSLSLHVLRADSPQPSAFVAEPCSAYGAHVLV